MGETGKTLLQAGEDTLRSHASPLGPRKPQLPEKITRTEAEESVEKILNGDATKYELVSWQDFLPSMSNHSAYGQYHVLVYRGSRTSAGFAVCSRAFAGACPTKQAVRVFNRRTTGTSGFGEHTRSTPSAQGTAPPRVWETRTPPTTFTRKGLPVVPANSGIPVAPFSSSTRRDASFVTVARRPRTRRRTSG